MVANDLLNPSRKNLRIREDLQGTFVEGIKEVVLSPAHALSLIAAGEEHRHVGSTNFNLLSSRSHTIFTLNLIDLAGSESSRAETIGVRRKEGSYINKNLLTLGTLICTVTPASSNSEETHNTLKFAYRAKHIEIQASQNKIMDEKSLIKKYQNEIRQLKEELDQLKRGILSGTPLKDATEDNDILWKQKGVPNKHSSSFEKLEDGNVKLQSRLEQEEAAKAALLARIQRLTKLILVSTKATQNPRLFQRPVPRRRHSFGEQELACLPHRRRDIVLNSESNDLFVPMEGFDETLEVSSKGEKKNRKGLLNWFKLRKHDGGSAVLTSSDGDQSSLRKALTAPSTPLGNRLNFQTEQGMSNSLLPENLSAVLLSVDHEEFHSDVLRGEEAPLVSRKTTDQVDLLREQLEIMSGEVAFHTSVLKRLMEEAGRSTMNEHIEMEMKKVNDETKGKQQQIENIERQIKGKLDRLEHPLSHAELLEQPNEKAFELEVKTADNRILQDQLQQKNTDIIVQTGLQVHKLDPTSLDVYDELHQKAQQWGIGELNQSLRELTEAKAQLEAHNQKLLEESMYAKGLASAAGIELKALSGEVTKLMNHNERLASELASARNSTQRRLNNGQKAGRRDVHASYEREQALEVILMEKDQREAQLQKRIEESKQKEAFLEGELANMWVLVAKLKKGVDKDDMDAKLINSTDHDSRPWRPGQDHARSQIIKPAELRHCTFLVWGSAPV
ncbi:kinesin-II 85 kDa subunit-like isoform X1 [Panicum miliaceum]|uniref:Kinesin-II 85 kDa subunit-like isoform X1 n=1 Tax=Panicum miliaceum TaxID=4540 RepID=A0A3L6RXZ5_PANMI|nr:kinesin-II 85 kDa subunit-like isoform X1 [Panicum miliaceum]